MDAFPCYPGPREGFRVSPISYGESRDIFTTEEEGLQDDCESLIIESSSSSPSTRARAILL